MRFTELLKVELKRLNRRYQRARHSAQGFPDWETLLHQDLEFYNEKKEEAVGGPRVLIATSTGGHPAVTPIESILAVALTLRGAEVHFLLCDKILPGCLQSVYSEYRTFRSFVQNGPQSHLCDHCFEYGRATYAPLGLPLHTYSSLISKEEKEAAARDAKSMQLDDVSSFRPNGLAIGEHALAGALRFLARGTFDGEIHAEGILRRYVEAALLTAHAVNRLFDQFKFQTACFHHGIYVPQGIVGEVSRSRGIRVVNWNPAYRKQCFIFSHEDTYHHTLMDEDPAVWENLPWNETMESEILDYLKSRWKGTRDWIFFHEKPQEDVSKIAGQLGIDFSRPTIGMLTNVIWDAQLHYPANAFGSMQDWILRTIDYFSRRSDIQLLIRIHPAEIRGSLPSRQFVLDEIRKAFPVLPDNIFVIPPDSAISTYSAMMQCDSVLIYGTKTGVELTGMGIPVIVAGEAWIRNKGITIDASTEEEYFRLLDRLPLAARMDPEAVQRARKYAYHFFFRRMIPLSFVHSSKGWWPPYDLEFSSIRQLIQGKDRGLDVLCEGILNGSPFIYPAESLHPMSALLSNGTHTVG